MVGQIRVIFPGNDFLFLSISRNWILSGKLHKLRKLNDGIFLRLFVLIRKSIMQSQFWLITKKNRQKYLRSLGQPFVVLFNASFDQSLSRKAPLQFLSFLFKFIFLRNNRWKLSGLFMKNMIIILSERPYCNSSAKPIFLQQLLKAVALMRQNNSK